MPIMPTFLAAIVLAACGKPADRHIAAAREHQRLAIGVLVCRHLADEYHVVSAVIADLVAAGKARGYAVEQRYPAHAEAHSDAGELVLRAAAELFGQVRLVGSEDIDGEVRRSLKGGQARRELRQAPEHERRRQRHRIERIRSEPGKL